MRTRRRFILIGQSAIPEPDAIEWSNWFESNDRVVANDELPEGRVSTVFLGLDHQWGKGPPLLFETMVFGGSFDGEQDRYSTWDEAEAGHRAMVERVQKTRPTPPA